MHSVSQDNGGGYLLIIFLLYCRDITYTCLNFLNITFKGLDYFLQGISKNHIPLRKVHIGLSVDKTQTKKGRLNPLVLGY